MRQKIVIRVCMHCHKCKVAAFKIIVDSPGVDSVALVGQEKNQVEVIGDGIDSAGLVLRLRKKVAYAEIVSVGKANNVKKDENKNKNKLDGEGTSGGSTMSPPVLLMLPPPPPCYHYQPCNDDPVCTIM